MHACMHASMQVCMYACMHVWMDICMYACMYACDACMHSRLGAGTAGWEPAVQAAAMHQACSVERTAYIVNSQSKVAIEFLLTEIST